MNARTSRAVYFIRRAEDVKAEVAGSVFMTFLDAVTGFNLVVNTPRARQMLAIIAHSGKFLLICLTFGPVKGPEDFAYVVDRNFAPGREAKSATATSGKLTSTTWPCGRASALMMGSAIQTAI